MQTKTQTSLIVDIILNSIAELNQQLPLERQLNQDVNTVLFGESGHLKSLELVNLILIVEEKLEDELDAFISLTDERAMSQKRSPFRTVARLADYIDCIMKGVSS